MGRTNPDRIPIRDRRRFAETVGQMQAQGWDVIARCDHCRVLLRVDLRVVIQTRGAGFSLWNRKTRCRVVGCTGWASFLGRPPDLTTHRPLSAPWPEGRPPKSR
jgi:hypothetical protein